MDQKGYLVISLDFELLWGVFDMLDPKLSSIYFKNALEVIPEILQIFEVSGIHCTWATVGMLFNKDWKEWEENIPAQIPQYLDQQLSAYVYGEKNKMQEKSLFFAPGIIEKIINSPGQELATHTYSHYYCQEEGQDLRTFEADLRMAVAIGKKFGVEIRSLVFPRNQFKREYLEVCSAYGIQTVRTNPETWYWKDPSSEALLTKIFRTGDAYNLLGKRKSYSISSLSKIKNIPLEQRASRFLRPHGGNKMLNKIRLKRIKDEMTAAAINKEIYHLWWHPHNFGEYPAESLQELNEIISHFEELRNTYGFSSVHMGELTEIFLKYS